VGSWDGNKSVGMDWDGGNQNEGEQRRVRVCVFASESNFMKDGMGWDGMGKLVLFLKLFLS